MFTSYYFQHFYFQSLLEIFLYEAFPELQQYREVSIDEPVLSSNPSSPTPVPRPIFAVPMA